MADPAALVAPYREELLAAFAAVLERGRFVLGPEGEALEASLADRLGAAHAVLVSSGTAALESALDVAGVEAGDLVVTTPFSFVSTASVIIARGATPVFIDIDARNFGLDARAVKRWVRTNPEGAARVRAIVHAQLFGACDDLSHLASVATELGATLIEDAAQAIDARSERGRPAGSFGGFGCFSFYPTKNLGGLGDGGLVLTQDEHRADRLRSSRSPCAPKDRSAPGANRRMSELSAAALRVLLPKLASWTDARRRTADLYDEAVLAAGLTPPARGPGHVVHQYTVRVPERRDALARHLENEGVETSVYYPSPISEQGDFPKKSLVPSPLAETDRACREVLALPVHPAMTDAQRAHVIEALGAWSP